MVTAQHALVFFDLETGGLLPHRHPIIQIAALAVDEHLEPLESIEAKIRFDESKARPHSLRKNHYSRGQWANEAVEPREAAHCFAAFLKRYAGASVIASNGSTYRVAQLVAHNAEFDGPFLQAWYERLGIFLPARFQVLCTLQRAQWFFTENSSLRRPKNLQLSTLCEYFDVPFHAAKAHEALGDVTATYLLYRAISKLGRPSTAEGQQSFVDQTGCKPQPVGSGLLRKSA